MNKTDYPIKRIVINANDHRPPRPMSGDSKVFGDGASPERRKELSKEVDKVIENFRSTFVKWPDLPAVAKVTLKKEALAKSHRPMALFSKRSCPIIGTLDFGEILVSATVDGLDELKDRIKNNHSKKQTANISAIEKIEPYDSKEWSFVVNDRSKIKLRLFDHKNEKINTQIKQSFYVFSKENNLSIKAFNYGKKTVLTVEPEGDTIEKLSKFIGLRSLSSMPNYVPTDIELTTSPVSAASTDNFPPPDPDVEYPVVGVIDSGVCPNSSLISPWVIARETYVPQGQEDYSHGTMVAGLIANSRALNHSDLGFPASQCKVVDVNVFPKGSPIDEGFLVSVIEEVVKKHSDVKIWNLSLGGSRPVEINEFSDFANFLDEMHDDYGCLFVVASGNQNNPKLWPTELVNDNENRLSSPGDSVRALTVGSIAHKDTANTLVKKERVSPFSRVGPGPCHIPKPEIVHYGGNICRNGMYAQTGILSLGPNNTIYESVGTSFATPIVSSQAAQLMQLLSEGLKESIPPERVKALLIHSAILNHQAPDALSVRSFGFGKPGDIVDTLYCDPHCITMMFDVDLKHGGFEFERVPFPIPESLINSEGKFTGEVAMTLAYSPELDRSYASEYCRTNVDAGFGSYDFVGEENNKRKFNSRVPSAPKNMNDLYEKSRIENGFKWSPIKAYHKVFPVGVLVDTWRLKLQVQRRAEEPMPDTRQMASLIISLRSLNPEQPIYNEAVQAMNKSGWIAEDIDLNIRIRAQS